MAPPLAALLSGLRACGPADLVRLLVATGLPGGVIECSRCPAPAMAGRVACRCWRCCAVAKVARPCKGKTRPRIMRRCGVDLVRLLVATACPVV